MLSAVLTLLILNKAEVPVERMLLKRNKQTTNHMIELHYYTNDFNNGFRNKYQNIHQVTYYEQDNKYESNGER